MAWDEYEEGNLSSTTFFSDYGWLSEAKIDLKEYAGEKAGEAMYEAMIEKFENMLPRGYCVCRSALYYPKNSPGLDDAIIKEIWDDCELTVDEQDEIFSEYEDEEDSEDED